jgi:hypothetical protein
MMNIAQELELRPEINLELALHKTKTFAQQSRFLDFCKSFLKNPKRPEKYDQKPWRNCK